MRNKPSRQFSFDFEGADNPLRERLWGGAFQILFEIDAPSHNRKEAASLMRNFVAAIPAPSKYPVGVSVTERLESVNGVDAAEFASEGLPDQLKNTSIIFVSGRGRSVDEMVEALESRRALGFRNVVAVTGDGYETDSGSPRFSDSIHAIKVMSEMDAFFPGCVVNPFKYLTASLFPQFFKLVKKINLGAELLIAQAGWDIVKLRDLIWFLDSRELVVPVIARTIFLSQDRLNRILGGDIPGIYISRHLEEILKEEGRHGSGQFTAAQWRRLQFQVAGARAVGCSGVQIAGIDSPEHVATAVSKIVSALEEFDSFQAWFSAYSAYVAQADMAPPDYRFKLYQNSLKHSLDTVREPASVMPLEPSVWEKARYKTSRVLLSDAGEVYSGERKITKTILTGCLASCRRCRLPETHFICPMACPKGLSNGPCGGTKIDGSCELRPVECVHAKRTRLAAWLNELDLLEEKYIGPVE